MIETFKMQQIVKYFVILSLFSLSLLWAGSVYADEEGEREPEASGSADELLPSDDLEAGKLIYEKRCISCHGVEGDGDGPASEFFLPKPRSFKKAEYKYRTTPKDSLPSDEDLFRAMSSLKKELIK